MIQLKYPKEEFFKMSLIKKLKKVLVFSSFLGLSFSIYPCLTPFPSTDPT